MEQLLGSSVSVDLEKKYKNCEENERDLVTEKERCVNQLRNQTEKRENLPKMETKKG